MKVLVDCVNKKVSNYREEQFVHDGEDVKHFPQCYTILYLEIKTKEIGCPFDILREKFGEVFFAKFDLAYDDYGVISHFLEIDKDGTSYFYECKI